jgi:hypothetical protein
METVQPAERPITREDLDWLAAHIVEASPSNDAGTLLSEIRDDGEWATVKDPPNGVVGK